MKRLAAVLLAGIFVFCATGQSRAATRFVTIGTGGVTGVYYPVGGAISKLVNAKRKEYNLRMTVESTGGSVFNVNALANGDIELGVVQSDIQYQAYNGKGDWEGKPQKKLRAMFSMHPEAVTILAAADKNIRSRRRPQGENRQHRRSRHRPAGQRPRPLRRHGHQPRHRPPGRRDQALRGGEHAAGRAHRRLLLHRRPSQRLDQGSRCRHPQSELCARVPPR